MYDGSQAAKIFDGDWDKHKSDNTYEQQFVVADQRYSRLLNILFEQLRGSKLINGVREDR